MSAEEAGEVVVRRIAPGEGAVLRRVRLAALAESPGAFSARLEDEDGLDADDWNERARRGSAGADQCTFVAVRGHHPIGLVGGHRDAGRVELFSMWTAPEARGAGVGAALVHAVVDWAHPAPVELWVTTGNDAAQRLYERCGFVVIDGSRASPSDPCRGQVRMRRHPG